MLLINYYFK